MRPSSGSWTSDISSGDYEGFKPNILGALETSEREESPMFAINSSPIIIPQTSFPRFAPLVFSDTSSETAERKCQSSFFTSLIRLLLVLEVSNQVLFGLIWTIPSINLVGSNEYVDMSNMVLNIFLICWSWKITFDALCEVEFDWAHSQRKADKIIFCFLILCNCGACCLWRDAAERYRENRSQELCCKCHTPGASFRKTEIKFYKRWVVLFVGFAVIPLFHEMIKYFKESKTPEPSFHDEIITFGVAVVLNCLFFSILVIFASSYLKDEQINESSTRIRVEINSPKKPSIGKNEYVLLGGKPHSFHESKLRSFSSECSEQKPHFQIAVAIPASEITCGEFIAGGSFGAIFKGKYSGATVALKYINKTTKKHRAALMKEYKTLNKLPYHKNVLQILGYCDEPGNECLVLDFIDGPSLFSMIQEISDRILPELEDRILFSILYQCAMGIEHMHKFTLIHRDIAARNVLCNQMYCITIIDFGLSRFADKGGKTATAIGPVRWMAPETIMNEEVTYSTKSDVWAFGCLVYELLELTVPYPKLSDLNVILGLRNETLAPTPTKTWKNPKLQSLCDRCWGTNPKDRPEMKEIREDLNHLLVEETQKTRPGPVPQLIRVRTF